MSEPPLIKVFISSPVDVKDERDRAELVVARLDNIWRSHVRLAVKLWERQHFEAAISFQEAIGEMAAFDVVVGVLWKRVGSELSPDLFVRPDGTAYESGTVFELETALAAREKDGRPTVYLLRKSKPVTYGAATVDEERRQDLALQQWWNRTVRDAEGHFVRGYHSFVETDDFETLLEAILEDYLRARGLIPSGAAWDVRTRGSPYPGLVAYDEEHTDVFFGRSLAIAAALDDLRAAARRDCPVLYIVGPSGSGKSSLARAGLAPHLSRGFFEGIDFWRPILVEPVQDPLSAFAERLYAPDGLNELGASPERTPEAFAELAKSAPKSAAALVRWGLEAAGKSSSVAARRERALTGRLLITVDQLEAMIGTDGWRPLARLVRALVEDEAAWLIATLRSDRYADLQADADLMALRSKGALFDLPAPGESEVREIIKAPAHAAGLLFEEQDGRALAQTLSQAVSRPDALPLLQMTLAKLFDNRRGDTLTFEAYNALGGLEGAIAAHAEAVFATVSPAGQAALDGLLQALVEDIDEAGRLSLGTPRRDSLKDAAELVDRLVEARLLVAAGAEVRVAHEALLRHWTRAAQTPALQPEVIHLRRQIEPGCEVWGRTGLESDLLQAGSTTLAAADRLAREHPGALSGAIEAYIKRSVEAADASRRAELDRARVEARRAHRRAAVLAALVLVSAVVAALAFGLYRQANQSYGLALLANAAQLLTEDDPARALVTAAAAARLAGDSDAGVRARTIAQIAQPAHSAPLWSLKLPRSAKAAALSGDGRFAVGDDAGDIIVGQVARVTRAGYRPDLWLHGGGQDVLRLAFLPDGRRLVSATSAGVVVWDLTTRTARRLCGGPANLDDVAVDPGGRFVAAVGANSQLAVWDLQKTDNPAVAGGPSLGAQRTSDWLVLGFSQEGSRLAASDADGTVHVFRASDWRELPGLDLPTGERDLISIAFSPNGGRLATASQKGVVELWDLGAGASGKPQILDRPIGKLWAVAFAPDGSTLATAGWDGAVRFWGATTLAGAGVVDANDLWVHGFAMSPDSHRLLTAGEDGVIRLWNLGAIAPMVYTVRDNADEAIRGRYSPDGAHFVTAGRDGFSRLYDVDSAGRIAFVCAVDNGAWVQAIAVSSDGRRAASVGESQKVIHVWDVEGAQGGRCREQTPIATGAVSPVSLAWNPRRPSELAWGADDGGVRIEDVDHQDPAPRPLVGGGHAGSIIVLAYDPSGKTIASGGDDGRVILWDTARRRLAKVLRSGGQGVGAIRFLRDGRLLTSGADDGIEIWDPSKPTPLQRTLDFRGGATALALSSDDRLLAADGYTRTVMMWTVADWRPVFELGALAGVRGAWDFNPKRGDLAFDGEDGLVRVLPNAASPARIDPSDLKALIVGTDVYFDRHAPVVTDGQAQTIINAPPAACQAPP